MTSFAVYIGDEIGNTAISKLGDSKLCAPRHAHKSKQIVKGQQFVDLGPRKALGEITNRAYPQVSSKPGQAHIGAPGRGEKLTCTTHLPSCSKPVHMDKHAQNNPTPKLTVPTITPISASICAIEKKEVDTVEITSHEDIEQMHLYDFPAHQRCQQEFGIEVSRIIMPFSHVPAVITTGSKDDSVNTEYAYFNLLQMYLLFKEYNFQLLETFLLNLIYQKFRSQRS